MAFVDSVIIFIVGLVIGALGIHIALGIVTGDSDFSKALVVALIGSLVWGTVSFFIGGIPLLGPVLTLLAWIGTINIFYRGGWVNAAAVGLLAWVSVSIILYLLAVLGIGSLEAIGVPG